MIVIYFVLVPFVMCVFVIIFSQLIFKRKQKQHKYAVDILTSLNVERYGTYIIKKRNDYNIIIQPREIFETEHNAYVRTGVMHVNDEIDIELVDYPIEKIKDMFINGQVSKFTLKNLCL